MTATVLLETRKMGVSFGGVHAVKEVDFTLHEGELRCLIGPNGAGKSTFFKMLSGQVTPTRGQCRFRNQVISGKRPWDIARLGIGIKTQVPSVFEGLSVWENLWQAAANKLGKAALPVAIDQVLHDIGLQDHQDAVLSELAHGQRQWVELGMILISRPQLVLLDEPAAGMTHQEVRKTAQLIKAINQQSTVVVVEHDMEFISMIAQQVTVFNQGAVLAEGSFREVTQNPLVKEAYLGNLEIKHV
ncbi:ATP-binding cassette domain-containing protein (plasmid) [Klebsiella michiganensis]|uniref:ATP-binding cassette domain-containing protein n=1 Tax=Klebsiella michiganensis TaxID=1134687 RepID=UPI00265B4A86|nr:ATP-binding cassette domain-containing protein [Klebsiella michiganensis]WKJ95806.1 ATP-binding cassette domain-containing protein [Klebsiella michiganensis]WKK01055.1 ATP-binding cassette domain-containing protein [Klebsiella michiganensis]WKK02848.1 ATP-binding cassette domain-containing protein [Klebsiella michiganensis]WKK07030.1 ATP-binding cassette domain-containing protein [Klebsiella michiganensis]